MFSKVTRFLSRSKAARRKATRREAFRASLRHEQLEDRRLMAVTHSFNNGILTITGDDANDVINVQQSSMNVFYQANGSGNLGITPVGSVTAVVVNAGGGNDTVTAPTLTKPLTIIGGEGDDTLSGTGGADIIHGDDVPTQTFSPADPFTISQNAGTNGFGSPWVNIQPGSLFNQRQVARFNNASSVSVASATQDWKATLPNANSSSTALTYRQDNSYSTIDLSGIASMSFDINVTGSVTGYWYLMDPNGYIAEVPAGFALSAGTHTVTLDLSTAAIDDGFDLSAVREMRIWISAASANSSVSVSNLRNGVIAPTLVTSDADPFTTVGVPGGAGAVYTPIQPGSLFNQRRVQRFNSATAAVGGGAWTATLPTSSSTSRLGYRQDNVGTTIDLSEVVSMSFDINVTGSVKGYWYLMDPNGYIAEVPAGFALSAGTHTVTLDLSTAAIDDGFDLSAVASMEISIAAASANSSFSVSNLDVTSGAAETGGNDVIDGRGGSDFLFGRGGNDTFRISNARDAFGDRINGGSGLDTVKNVTTAETVVLTDFRTTNALGSQTVFGVEQFDGNGKSEIRGRDAAFDGLGNDVDALDFTGIDFIGGVTTINLRSGDDQYIGGNNALTVNGGSGNDTMSAAVGGGTLNGEAGIDTLTGGTAATTLNGGAGADILNAGVGATTFSFNILETNNAEDQVFGFRKGTDKIRLNTSVYGQGQLAVVAGSSPSGTGASSQIRYNNNGVSGDTTIYLPGTGTNAFRRIKLVGFFGTLDSTDFIQV